MRRWETCLMVVLSAIALTFASTVFAQNGPPVLIEKGPVNVINKHFSTSTMTFSDGTILDKYIINGPPRPPAGFEHERAPVSLPKPSVTTTKSSLSEVPAFNWVFGCSSVSGAMIAGYYDRTGFDNIYTGPTGDGWLLGRRS